MLYDVVIIGGGPAGLTAGLYASRARLKTLLVEKGLPGGLVTTTEWVENYPGFEEGILGAELAQKMEKQAQRFGLEIVQGSVNGINCTERVKKILLEDDKSFDAKSIIITTGANPRLLQIEGENEFRGRGVSYCATCDGAFYRGKKIAVVGGGDSAVQESIFLTKFAETVYVVHRRDQLRAEKILQERAMGNTRIRFIWNSVVEKINGNDGVSSLDIRNVKTGERSALHVDGIFIYIGYNPNTELLSGLLALDENRYIVTNENMATSVPGVFAAGDVRSKPLKQIATAVGDGATAAMAAEKYVEENF